MQCLRGLRRPKHTALYLPAESIAFSAGAEILFDLLLRCECFSITHEAVKTAAMLSDASVFCMQRFRIIAEGASVLSLGMSLTSQTKLALLLSGKVQSNPDRRHEVCQKDIRLPVIVHLIANVS